MICSCEPSHGFPDSHEQEADGAPQVLEAAPQICGGLIDVRSGSGPGTAPYTTRVLGQSKLDFLQHPYQRSQQRIQQMVVRLGSEDALL